MFFCVHLHLVHIVAVELLLIHTDHSKGHTWRTEHLHTATFCTYLFFVFMFCAVLSDYFVVYFLSSCKSFPHSVQQFDQLLYFTITPLGLFIIFSLIISFCLVLIVTLRGFLTITEYLCPSADILVSWSNCTKDARLSDITSYVEAIAINFFFSID